MRLIFAPALLLVTGFALGACAGDDGCIASCSDVGPQPAPDANVQDSGPIDRDAAEPPIDAGALDARPDVSTLDSGGSDAGPCVGSGACVVDGATMCIDTSTDPLHCGGCNVLCNPSQERCVSGDCVLYEGCRFVEHTMQIDNHDFEARAFYGDGGWLHARRGNFALRRNIDEEDSCLVDHDSGYYGHCIGDGSVTLTQSFPETETWIIDSYRLTARYHADHTDTIAPAVLSVGVAPGRSTPTDHSVDWQRGAGEEFSAPTDGWETLEVTGDWRDLSWTGETGLYISSEYDPEGECRAMSCGWARWFFDDVELTLTTVECGAE